MGLVPDNLHVFLPSHLYPISIVIVGVAGALFCLIVSHFARRQKTVLPDVPWVGSNSTTWFGILRTRWWTMLNYESALALAYREYGLKDKACMLGTLDGEVVLLPPSSIPWLISQPSHVLSVNGAHKHILQTKYSFPRPEIMDPTVHFDVIKSELTRQMFSITPEVSDEMRAAISDVFGEDPNSWREVKLFDAVIKTIARTSNRVFVGLPLCRDEEYLRNAIGFAEDIALSATVLRLMPTWLLPVVERIATHSNRKHARAYTDILRHEILHRQRSQQQVVEKPDADAKNDFLQWLLNRSINRDDGQGPDETDPEIICARLLHTNFASVHTTGFIGTNAILDILAAPTSDQVIETLRQEALDTVDAESGPESKSTLSWSRASLQKQHLFDSALRESARMASIIGVGVNHYVVAPEGVTTADGIHLPQGCMLATHSWGLHHDEDIYSDARRFKAFRFAEMRKSGPGEVDDRNEFPDGGNLQFIATSERYLGFGHGRHACPGRFFASAELKLLLAYLLVHYDLEIVGAKKGERPPCFWAGPNHVPPMRARVKARRRRSVT
ncbi:hypothetical protein B0A52_09838 [Exophiala mesophila]|uniref:Cytochrome P450 n=1 Tax=Exophiala mesophila TaxID=212818 RepID=A0A438MSC3_EXOME|nr:hypothetical protein B0A52_09838 [Exophiala mesophila]